MTPQPARAKGRSRMSSFMGAIVALRFPTVYTPEMITRTCHRCRKDKPATKEHFVGDKSRPMGIAYECRPCHSARKKGRDRRLERWVHMTAEQKQRKKTLARAYGRTLRGRAIFLRNAYQRIDACDLTTEEIMALIEQPCVHCGTLSLNRGLDRMDNGLPHVKGNVSPSCVPCNFARGDRFTFDEMQEIGAVIRRVLERRGIETKATENVVHLENYD
jgi:hypothetical protein